MAFEWLNVFIYGGPEPRAGEEVKFRRVHIQQHFRWNGDLCERLDRCRDMWGAYNAVTLGGEGGPRRVYILDHEKVEVVD